MPKQLDLNSLSASELIALVKEVGGQRPFERKYGIPRTTLQARLKKARDEQWNHRPVLKPIEERVDQGVRRFILTSAQDRTVVHEGFLAQLEAYCAWLNEDAPCDIMIAGFTYNKSLFEDHAKRSGLFHHSLTKYLVFDHININGVVDFCAELNTRPTASNPLNGCENFTEDRWGIFPHAKLQIKSVPTHKQKQPKILLSTGCVTRTNYVPLRAGIKAELEHSLSAVLVETDHIGKFFCRHLIAEEDGSFYDLDRRISNGVVTTGHNLKSITWGDLHVKQIDPEVCAASFGIMPTNRRANGHRVWVENIPGSVIDTMRPEYQQFEDVSDFYARNHHNIKNALAPDQSHTIDDIENGMHGHEGVNGSRGSIAGYRRTGIKATFGHAHSCAVLGDVWQSGTKSKLDLGYNGGMSSWSHSDVWQYQNGHRVMITFHGNAWNIPVEKAGLQKSSSDIK